MPRYYRLRSWQGHHLCVDLSGRGSIVNAPDALLGTGRAGLLGCVPEPPGAAMFLMALLDQRVPIRLEPHPYQNPIVAVQAQPVDSERLALCHPLTRKYLCVAPVEPGQTASWVCAERASASDWEFFNVVAVDKRFLPSTVLRAGDILERLLARPLDADSILRFLESPAEPMAGDALNAVLPMIGLEDLRRIAAAVLDRPELARRLAALCPGDVWATIGLPALLHWRSRQEQAGTVSHPRKLPLGRALDFLEAGQDGSYASFGHACNALARSTIRPRGLVCVVTTARNEGIYILEWIAYHRCIGIQYFFFYSNDNDDGSDELLSALCDAGVLTWIDNQVSPGCSAQNKAYGHAFGLLPDLLDYRWALVIDLDEFFVFNPAAFASAREFLQWQEKRAVDAIACNWLCLGSGAEGCWQDELLTRRNTRVLGPQHVGWGFRLIKTISRPAVMVHSGAHDPTTDERRGFVFRLANGDMHTYSDPPPEHPRMAKFADRADVEQACVYHYLYKSAEEFLWKFSRNRGDYSFVAGLSTAALHAHHVVNFMEQHDAADVAVEDRIGNCAPNLEREMQSLLSLPGVAEANARVKRRYQERAREVKQAFRAAPALREAGELGRRFLELAGVTEAG